MNIADALTEHTERRPDHPALIDGARTITYRELDPLVRRTAAHLATLGAGQGDIVGVALGDNADHLVLLYAVARLGAAILPMDVRWTQTEKSTLADFFKARFVICETGGDLGGGVTSIPVGSVWHDAVANAGTGQDFPSEDSLPLVLSLSSGTTGRPKGPMITHRHMLARFENQRVTLNFREDDRYFSVTPLYFGGGRHFTMGFLFQGATVVFFPPPFEPQQLVAAAAKYDATVTLVVPTILRRLLQLPGQDEPVLGGLRLLYTTGAVLHPDERRAVLARVSPNLINYYGSTEGGGISVLLPEHGGPAEKSVGTAVSTTEIQVVSAAHAPVPAGEIGRIRYRGPCVADGFYNDPEASAESFRDGWFYPGDLGRLDDAGFLYLAGRAKDMIIRAGVNIYPEEVEQTLLTHPAVRDAAVLGWPSPDKGEEVAAFVVTSGAVSEAALQDHCRERIAPYKVPRGIFFVDDLPKNSMGKVVKPELAERLPKTS